MGCHALLQGILLTQRLNPHRELIIFLVAILAATQFFPMERTLKGGWCGVAGWLLNELKSSPQFLIKIPVKGFYSFPLGLLRWFISIESICSAGDPADAGSIPGLGRSPGEGNGHALQHFCLEDPVDGGAWRAAVHGAAKSWTRLSPHEYT